MKTKSVLSFATLVVCIMLFFTQCTIVRPGEVAILTRLGKVNPDILQPGMHGINPFTNTVTTFGTRVQEYSSNMHLPTKEGLEITAELTFLQHILPDSVPPMFKHFGFNYNQSLIVNTYTATAREVTAHYYAKDLITQREELEKALNEKLAASLGKYGIVMEAVLVRDIELPEEILQAIKDKVKSEQASLQAQFDIEKQRKELNFNIETQQKQTDFAILKKQKEADMMIIEANAIRLSQQIIDSSLSDKQLRYKSLEITKSLLASPNAKIIITDGKSPVILNASSEITK